MTAAIRIAGADDVPALYALLQAAYAPLVPQGVHFTITRSPIARVAQTVARETTFVLEHPDDDGRTTLAATLTVRFPWVADERHRTPYPFLHWFAVAPAFKRQGLGRALLAHVESPFLTAQVKAPATYLATASNHPWLQPYYERDGYVAFDRSTNALGTPLVWLRKILIPALYRDPSAADAAADDTAADRIRARA
ncbi:GNAT family N-acetyltransferase [Burkholderia pseudomultivorans]|uniref:GCN5 family acetyltransferase n=1 Tax=Burkholderia pseudomultivorans TaxID=1207504 RepID=A0A132EIB1_9BURK|nr:GNAT family N-acetyltransferase [Burkholderia pseudomultivorans]KWF30853.1 GCN5 family acetyltransferase [Burkholderia pseudomultivorans]MDR8729692.1 putative N-acetyltransferase YtmI [Burkholderia pseudomultivorans]MDR8736971.1 putative N-acetyltransferase YtmI [Burkholderia pseudomultivorans]MDR8743134.1 putative N-acetyltransferase YtmI [Burkholderia pseudomultivorans]MDR8754509.1 putative N-acetyltransferase YtmI [Burkholderia pseudomultivorans]